MNMKSAFLHMMADAATSLGVAALGILWMFKPWYWLDPLFSWLIVAMILYSGWGGTVKADLDGDGSVGEGDLELMIQISKKAEVPGL